MKTQIQQTVFFENTVYRTQLQMEIAGAKPAKEGATLKGTGCWWLHRRAQLNLEAQNLFEGLGNTQCFIKQT